MADQPPRRPRTLNDARSEAEAAFKKATAFFTDRLARRKSFRGARNPA